MKITEIIMYGAALVAVLPYRHSSGTYLLGQHGGFNVKILSLIDAAYFTVATMSTPWVTATYTRC